MWIRLIAMTCSAALARPAAAQLVYSLTPDWVSTDAQVGTGGALADLDRDGWLDLIVANGNDMAQQRVTVFYNQADGTYPTSPDWQSSDIAYNGHLDVADVNGDGWLDVAVATLGSGSTTAPIARLYLNNSGTLSSLPNWSSGVIGNAFGVGFGDMNGDGRADLAIGTGWAYSPQLFYRNYVYINTAGALPATPSWQSDDTYHYQGVLWVDGNRDGLLDLVGAASRTYSRMYLNLGTALETTASWRNNDVSNMDAIMATAGDVTLDGLRDLYIADNSQLTGGSGRFRQYAGAAAGSFATTANWTYNEGYCSAVALADVNADGLLDLATGAWWDQTRIFRNTAGNLGASAWWNSTPATVVEKIVFGDIDKNALRPILATFPASGTQRLFYLAHQPIQEMLAVRVDGTALTAAQYTFSREHGWISLGVTPTVDVEVDYTYSSKLDMAVTNWDAVGNHVYYNLLIVRGDANCDGSHNMLDVGPFIDVLIDRPAYDAAYPDCDVDTFCDMDGDGDLDGEDLRGFVAELLI